MRCGKFYGLDYVQSTTGVPKCDCGGTLKPDVVLYGESLDGDTIQGACEAIAGADLLIIGGTSLNVYPAAGFIYLYRGKRLVLANMSATPRDSRADLIIRDPIGKVFEQLP